MATTINNSGIVFPGGGTQTSAGIINSSIPALSVKYTSSTSISNATNVKVPFNSVVLDTHSGWVAANNSYTVQQSGYYQVNAGTQVSSNSSNFSTFGSSTIYTALTRINYNNSSIIQSGQWNSTGWTIYGLSDWAGTADTIFYLTAGNSIWVETLGYIYTGTLYNKNNWFNLYFIRS